MLRKLNLYIIQKVTEQQTQDKNLNNFHTSSVRTSYSIDSSNSMIIPKSMDSFEHGDDNFRLHANYSLKPAPHFV